MKNKLHFIITGEEGQTRSYAVSKFLLKCTAFLCLGLLTILLLMSTAGVDFFFKNNALEDRVAGLDKDIRSSISENVDLKERVSRLEQEKEALLKNAVGELNEKSRLIESILSTVGVGVKVQESGDNSGGPFYTSSATVHEGLIFKADRYLETIQSIPLGAPVPGIITSKFGRRQDPINSKSGFHNGVDIRGRRGTEIKATADGVVFRQGYDDGYGRFVIIDHEQGFRTMFGHMKKTLVQQGDQVSRGQVIGLLGNTGRSTGPHVHYEIKHRDQLVDPVRFMRVANYLSSKALPPPAAAAAPMVLVPQGNKIRKSAAKKSKIRIMEMSG